MTMSRLTNKDIIISGARSGCKTIFTNVYNKLGKIEDLMEKYNINDLVELEIALDYYDHRYDKVETRRIDN